MNRSFRAYFEPRNEKLPEFYLNIIRSDLGIWMNWLPEGALEHDQNAYMHKTLYERKAKAKAGKIPHG